MATRTDCAATDTLLLMTVCFYMYSRHTSGYFKYRSAWSLEETALSKAGSKPAPIHESRARAVASTLGKRFAKTEKEKWSVFSLGKQGTVCFCTSSWATSASIPRLHCGVWGRRTDPTGRCQSRDLWNSWDQVTPENYCETICNRNMSKLFTTIVFLADYWERLK